MMKKRAKSSNSGFTLLEVILSIAILGMITLPLMNYFSESLRFSAMTAQQQKATLLAQDTIESLKAYDKLITRTVNETDSYYWVSVLAGRYGVPLPTPAPGEPAPEYSVYDGLEEFNKDQGTTGDGNPLILTKTVERDGLEYDVYVSLSTDVDANTVERPVIYGVDDRKNVMIVEGDQEQEAILRFMALNSSYVLSQAIEGGSPDPSGSTDATDSSDAADEGEGSSVASSEEGGEEGGGADPVVAELTENDVRRNLQREIFIEVSKESIDASAYYTVKAYYEYSCSGVTDKPKDTYQTSNLIDTRMAGLESIYLLFNMVDPDTDVIHISWNTAMGANPKPEIVLVCQNLDQLSGGADPADPSEPSDPADPGLPSDPADPADPPFVFTADKYNVKLDLKNFNWNIVVGGTPDHPVIRTNIVEEDAAESKGSVTPLDSPIFQDEHVVPLTTTGRAIRVVQMEVKIFKHGDSYETGEPLVVMQTTKGE